MGDGEMIFDPLLDLIRGKLVTIPLMVGAFRPNTALDDAPVLVRMLQPDNLVLWQGQVVASSGANVQNPDGEVLQSFAADVSALTVSPSGGLVAALDDGRLVIACEALPLPAEVRCITTLV